MSDATRNIVFIYGVLAILPGLLGWLLDALYSEWFWMSPYVSVPVVSVFLDASAVLPR